MGTLLDRLNTPHECIVWLDHADFIASLFGKGTLPWLDVSEFVSLQSRAQSLLKSDILALKIAPACAAWLTAHATLGAAMRAKSRAVFPLKTLLAEPALRAHLFELVVSLRAGIKEVPLALVIPSPRAWVGVAYAQAHADGGAVIDNDLADSASVYVADFLRAFGSCGVDVLLLEEEGDFAPVAPADVACYQAVLNVAANYRWDAGLRIAGLANDAATAAFDYVVAREGHNAPRVGIEIPTEFWSTGGAAPVGRLRYAVIPAQAQPEIVLEQRARLR